MISARLPGSSIPTSARAGRGRWVQDALRTELARLGAAGAETLPAIVTAPEIHGTIEIAHFRASNTPCKTLRDMLQSTGESTMDLFTTSEAALYLKVSKRTITHYLTERIIVPDRRIGRSWVFTKAELDRVAALPKHAGGRPRKKPPEE